MATLKDYNQKQLFEFFDECDISEDFYVKYYGGSPAMCVSFPGANKMWFSPKNSIYGELYVYTLAVNSQIEEVRIRTGFAKKAYENVPGELRNPI